MSKSHQHDADYMEAMKKVAYDTLLIELRDFQVCLKQFISVGLEFNSMFNLEL